MKKTSLLLIGLTLLLSCQFTQNQEERYTDLEPIRLGAMSSMDYLPFVIAEKQGMYDSLGLDVKIIKFFSANERDAAFQSGNIDGTVIDYTGAALQQANGIPLKIVMKNDGFFHLITGKEKQINTLKELKGKNIAVSRNTVIEYSTDQILAKAGIPVGDINKPEINKIPLRLEMLQSGQIDASIFPDPFAAIAIQNGHHSLITTQDLGISVTGTVFTEKALNEKRREIEVLIKGYNQAVEYINRTAPTEWAEVLVKDAGVPEALVEKVVLPHYEKAALPSGKDIQYTLEWLKSKKLIPESYQGTLLIDTIKGIKTGK